MKRQWIPCYCNQVVRYLFKNMCNQDDQTRRSSNCSMFNNGYWEALNTLTEHFQLHLFVHAFVVVSSDAPFQGPKCMVFFMFKRNKNPSTFNVIIKSLVLSAYVLWGYICSQPYGNQGTSKQTYSTNTKAYFSIYSTNVQLLCFNLFCIILNLENSNISYFGDI